jgi:integrase
VENPNERAAPSGEIRSVPVRPTNAELRRREYLTPSEVDRLTKSARSGRYAHRDATLIMIAFRHGLRAQEICDLEWSQVEFGRSACLHIRRVKNGKPSVHPLRGDEVRALRELRRQFPDSAFVFATERGGPFTTDAINRHIKRLAERVGFDFPVHVHMPAARLRLRSGERWARHAGDPRLAGPSVDTAYGAVHRTDADTLPRFLAVGGRQGRASSSVVASAARSRLTPCKFGAERPGNRSWNRGENRPDSRACIYALEVAVGGAETG